MKEVFYAELRPVPLKVDNFFFANSRFSFSPVKGDEPLGENELLPKQLSFSSSFQIADDSKKKFQVGVLIESTPGAEAPTLFSVHCIAIYTWLEENIPDEGILKRIYSWAVAVQVGAIRQHVIQETANGPFRMPYILPVTLVEIKNAGQNL